MPEKLLLINPAKPPSKRGRKKPVKKKAPKKATMRKKPMAKKQRTAAQKRATAKLVAFNRRKARGKSAPVKRRRKAPAKRRSTGRAAPVARRRASSVAKRRAAPLRRRRNPIKRKAGMVDTYLYPALIASSGALAVDIIWSYLPIPDAIKVGPMRHPAKVAIAVGASMLAGNVVNKDTADLMGVGAITVIGHNALRELVGTYVPGLKMDGIGYMSPAVIAGQENMGYYPDGMGYYPPQAQPGITANAEGEQNYSYN